MSMLLITLTFGYQTNKKDSDLKKTDLTKKKRSFFLAQVLNFYNY